MENMPIAGSSVEVSYSHGNRMVAATGRVVEADDNRVVLHIDGGDKSMTPETGSDLYLMKGGGLFNVLESKDFPRIVIEKVVDRRHARVNDTLTLHYRAIDSDRYSDGKANYSLILEEVFGGSVCAPEVENVTPAMLYQLLYQLNQKVDRILDAVDTQRREKTTTVPAEQINISAAGIRLKLRDEMELGTIMALQLELSLETCTRLQAMGKVVAVEPVEEDRTYRTAIQFLDLSEEEEDLLIRHVFKRQRELLRRD